MRVIDLRHNARNGKSGSWISTLSLFLFILGISALGHSLELPELSAPCQDEAQMLSPQTINAINGVLHSVLSSGGPQVQVLTLKSLEGEPIEEVSLRLVEKFKLGSGEKDNGLLFLIVKNDRKMRIEVGQGLEGDLPDVVAKRIISQVVTPHFKTGDFDQGVVAGVYSILKFAAPEVLDKVKLDPALMGNHSLGTRESPNGDQKSSQFFIGLFFIFFFIVLKILQFMGGGSGGSPFNNGRRNYYGGGFGGGGSSSGGSWSGGGGGFSGGGASGDW